MMLCGIISPAWPATAPAVGETELVNTALLNTWLRRAHPRGAEAVVLLPAIVTWLSRSGPAGGERARRCG